ncbi:MFS transporter [Petroclostridium sp. X23]|uniref:MFS transporter n=1 Tax=Petroclostridium sp. X23 TaxID=3045146 RepID=UPI0024ACF281|nr:MFS transporter [Petroclostridium sp. X23]WHH57560.1 MFS transporter [Petroclostridium sp. X23]
MNNRKKHIFLFHFVTGFFWFSLYAYVPTLATYVESLGASYKMVGIVLGSYGFTQMLLRIPLGILSDTLNKRKVFIILGAVLALVSSLGLWLFPNVGLVLLFRALSGVATVAWVTFTVLYSSYYEDDHAPKAIGILNSFNFMGQMAAIFLGGLAAQYFNQQAPFLVASVGGILALILSFGIYENKIDRKPLKLSDIVSVATDKNFMLISLCSILSQFITFGTMYGFTPVIAKQLGATDFQLSLLTNISTIPVIFASAMSGTLFIKYLGEKYTVMLGFLAAALASIATPYMPSIAWLYVIQFIGGFGRGLTFTLLMGISIKNIENSRRATAMGFFQAAYGIGMFLGPVVVGFFSDTLGISSGFWFSGFLAMVGTVITYFGIQSGTAG